MIQKWLAVACGFLSLWATAQTPWPQVQARIYPMTPEMLLIRHEQALLLGEGAQQTGLFFSTRPGAYSEKVQSELIDDAVKKGWQLHSIMRTGANYSLTFTQSHRILDIRLTNTQQGVDAVYSIVPNQQQSAVPHVVNAAKSAQDVAPAASAMTPAINR